MNDANIKNDPPFSRIAILGLGLMGGSLAKALLKTGQALQISTYDPSGAVLEGAEAQPSPRAAANGADLIILAAPLGAFETLLGQVADHLKPGTLVMDLGSVKRGATTQMSRMLAHRQDLYWVGGHPMCGSEKSGVSHARSSLYQGACFFLTEGRLATGQRSETALRKRLENFISSLGAKPSWTDAQTHDRLAAQTSHLPHLSAAALIHSLAATPEDKDSYIAGGFRDMTRIASGSEILWRDILLSNQAEVLSALSAYEAQLKQVRKLLESADSSGLEHFLKTAKTKRSQYVDTDHQR